MVAMKCDAVLCCRMSPRQKAQVINFLNKRFIFQNYSLIFKICYK